MKIICREPSHASRPAFIADLTPDGDTATQYVNQRPVAGEVGKLTPAVEFIDAQGKQVERPLGRAPREVRRRLALECPLCGLRVELRPETVKARLARGFGAGVPEVSLRDLIILTA